MSEDDDVPQLSAETFLALQEFYKEQDEREKNFSLPLKNSVISEDWQLSQFWYDEETMNCLTNIALKEVGRKGKIALVSCPTLYAKIKENLEDHGEVTLYEYDRRFSIYGTDFIPYDYKSPLAVPRERSNYYDLVIADPPFISEECLTKTAVTVKYLTSSKIIVCTGAIMENLVQRLLNLKKTSFRPKHKNNLANEFCCYTNFDIGDT